MILYIETVMCFVSKSTFIPAVCVYYSLYLEASWGTKLNSVSLKLSVPNIEI